ncbi:MAG: hypothetical protein Q8Q39_00105 [bacterium]|nr:hypothetical protein [bacterium]
MNTIIQKLFMLQPVSDKKGFITLISVLVVSAVGLSIALSLLLLGLGSSQTSFALAQSMQARSLANACAEESLRRVKNSLSFSGTSSLTFFGGTCTYSVANIGAQSRTITISGAVGTIVRKVSISISQITPFINVVSWQEIDNF